MDLQKRLDESGYTQSVEDLENARQIYRIEMENIGTAFPDKQAALLVDLAELGVWIKDAENALAAEYESTVKLVDAQNDLDLLLWNARN